MSGSAGAGHVRAAQALEAAFRENYHDVEVKNVDALEYTNALFRNTFKGTYNTLATRLPGVWGSVYKNIDRKRGRNRTKGLSAFVDRVNSRALLRLVEEFDPGAVVCTHYLATEITSWLRRKGRLQAPLEVVFTDYEIHAMWIQDGVDGYFVGTAEMAWALSARGAGKARISVTGIPIMPAFSRAYPPKAEMRRKLGIRTEPPTILVSAGGFGMLPVDEAVNMLAGLVPDVQILAVAGKNEKLHRALDAAARAHSGKVVPHGFVTNMDELMAASDLAVTKSGGLTSSECLAMGLPMVVWNPIPGQEEANADYLLENGAALRANCPEYLAFKVKKLLTEPALLDEMGRAARRISRPNAAADIAKEVIAAM